MRASLLTALQTFRLPPRSPAAPLFGYDIFLSFALGPPPRGTRAYAADLAAKLRERGFAVFFSEDEAPPGVPLSATLKRALGRSRLLVVLANRQTLADPRWVREEVLEFRRRHPRRSIVPISFDSALDDAEIAATSHTWLAHKERIWVDELQAALDAGAASERVVARVATAPTAVRSALWLRGTLLALTVLFATLAGAAVWWGRQATQAEGRALKAAAVAASSARAEEQAAREARTAERRASEAATQAASAAQRARAAASAAVQAERGERAQRLVAELRLREATAQYLAEGSAEELARQRHDRGLLAAVAAWDAERTPRAEAALLTALLHRPRLLRYVPAAANQAFAFVSGGKRFVSADRGGRLVWHDAQGSRPPDVSSRGGFSERLPTLVPSADGRWLAVLDRQHSRIWRTEPPEELPWAMPLLNPSATLAFSADGQLLAVFGQPGVQNVRLLETFTGKQRHAPVSAPTDTLGLGFAQSPDEMFIVRRDGQVTLVDLRQPVARRELRAGTGEAQIVRFAPRADRFAIGRSNAEIAVFDIVRDRAGQTTLRQVPHRLVVPGGGSLEEMALSADGRQLVVGMTDGRTMQVDLSSEVRPAFELLLQQAGADTRIALADNGLVLSAANRDAVALLSLHQSHPLRRPLPPGLRGVRTLVHSPDGTRLGAAFEDGSVAVLDAAAERLLARWQMPAGEPAVWRLAFSADGSRLAARRYDRADSLVWDVGANAAPPLRLPPGELHPDGRHFLIDAGHLGSPVRLVSLHAPERSLASYDVGGAGPFRSRFSTDGKLLAITLDSGEIRVWAAGARGQPTWTVKTEPLPLAATFRASWPGARQLIGQHRADAMAWSLQTGRSSERHFSWRAPAGAGAGGNALDIEIDGQARLLAIATHLRLYLWRLSTSDPLGPPIQLATSNLAQISFSADGSQLAVSGHGGVELIDTHGIAWRERACLAAARNMSCEEWARFMPAKPYRTLCQKFDAPRC